jgi:hypothetical protein
MLRELAIRLETYIHNKVIGAYLPEVGHDRVESAYLKAAVNTFVEDNALDTEIEWVFVDKYYFAPHTLVSDVGRITGVLPYRPERFDCEDYAALYKVLHAFVLGVNAIGIVVDWTGGHSYNIVILSDGTVKLIEPQNGKVVDPGAKGTFAFERVLIYI